MISTASPLYPFVVPSGPGGVRIRALIAFLALAGVSQAGTISGNVADYNAAEVKLAGGAVTVPAGVATYTATATIATGSSFTVTLPSGFTFATAPSLTTSGTSTFTFTSGAGTGTVTFTVATANVTSGQTISLASFSVNGATALETVTPVASALPLTMQAIGVDASALSFKAFASDVGAQAVFVGAVQYIDINPPSNGTEFFSTPDTLTAVISAIEFSRQMQDAATASVPILGSNGLANVLSPTDTATVAMFGNFGGIAQAFSSSTSDCLHPISYGTVQNQKITIPNVAINTEVFFCMTGSGAVIQATPNGFSAVTVSPGTSTDFLSAPVNIEFPGQICYQGSGGTGSFGYGCVNWTPPAVATPTLSQWGMIGLAGMMLLFGLWKLRATPIR